MKAFGCCLLAAFMAIALVVIVIVVGVAISPEMDVVTETFPDLAAAEKAGAFERGWLPPALPRSARNIIESNDLDSNIGIGSFEYELSERADYILLLKTKFGAIEKKGDKFFIPSEWMLSLPAEKGYGHYRMSLKPEGLAF